MKDQIILADTLGEPEKLGWTLLGRIDRDDCWQGTGWVYCKANHFVVFNECGPDIDFMGYLHPALAIDQLYCRRHVELARKHCEATADNQERVPNSEKYGYCSRCNKPLSEYEHNQGDHLCLDCWLPEDQDLDTLSLDERAERFNTGRRGKE